MTAGDGALRPQARGLRVAVNTLSVTPDKVGIRTMLTRLVPALVRAGRGHRYRLICSGSNVELFEALGDEVERVVLPTRGRGPVARIWHDQCTVPRLVRHGADVLFTPSNVGSILVALPQVVAFQAGLALPSIRREASGGRRSPAHRFYYGPVMRCSHRRAALVTPISEYIARRLLADSGLDPGKVEPILLGTDPVEWCPASDGGYALVVGTLWPYKNVAAAIDALAIARPRLPEGFRLVVLGRDPDGRQMPELASRAAAAGVADAVELLGHVEGPRLDQFYREATVAVLPARLEGFGLPALEALARGAPVIASNRGALPEVVGDAGILVDPDRPDELAARLAEVANDRALRARLVAAGRERAARLSWDRTARSYVEVFERVAAGRRRS